MEDGVVQVCASQHCRKHAYSSLSSAFVANWESQSAFQVCRIHSIIKTSSRPMESNSMHRERPIIGSLCTTDMQSVGLNPMQNHKGPRLAYVVTPLRCVNVLLARETSDSRRTFVLIVALTNSLFSYLFSLTWQHLVPASPVPQSPDRCIHVKWRNTKQRTWLK